MYPSGHRDRGSMYQRAFLGEGPNDGVRGWSEIGTGLFLGMSKMIGWQEEELCGTLCRHLSTGRLSLSSFMH